MKSLHGITKSDEETTKRKIYSNNKFFLSAALIAVLGTLFTAIVNYIHYPELSLFIMEILRAFCVLLLYISYKKHSKNIMKGTTGALLMALLNYTIQGAFLNFSGMAAENIFAAAALFSLILFGTHFIIYSDGKAKPALVRLNQVINILLTLCEIAIAIILIPGEILICQIGEIIFAISFSCTIASICIETRLDAYRAEREAAE